MIKAIPTTFRGVNFRSRLEAKWSAFFDACGWPWEYEPFEIGYYIPDFILKLHRPILVEVKPALTVKDLVAQGQKALTCGFDGEILLLGATLLSEHTTYEDPTLGVIVHWDLDLPYDKDRDVWLDSPEHEAGSTAHFQVCKGCKRYSYFSMHMSHHCRVCGAHDGTHYLGPVDPTDLWKQASNEVQWKPNK